MEKLYYCSIYWEDSKLQCFSKDGEYAMGENGEVDIRPTGQNLFIIQLSNQATRDRVLEFSP